MSSRSVVAAGFMHRVLLLDTKRSNPNHYLCNAIFYALRRHAAVETVVLAHWGNALSLARTHKTNLFVAFDGEELHQEIAARLASVCGRSLLWVTEDPYELSVNVSNASLFDLVCTTDSASVSHYGPKGRHLPLAGSQDIHSLEVCGEERLLYDVFFAGTAWPNRVTFFNEALPQGLDRFRLKLALPTNPHLPSPRLSLPESAWNWRTPNSEFVRFANRSRVTLLLPRIFSASGNKAYAETPGPRLFETALAAGVQLAHQSLVEVNQYLTEGREYLAFDSYPDLIDKIAFLAHHPEARCEIAGAAQQKIAALHTYDHRVTQLLAWVEKLPLPAVPRPAPTLNKKRPTLLMVSHNVRARGHFGGVEVYQDLLSHGLQGRYRVLFFLQAASGFHKYEVLDCNGAHLDTITLQRPVGAFDLLHEELERAFYTILRRYGVDLVHFQHCLNHTPSLVFVAKALGIPTVLSLHDYYPICHEFNLVGHHGVYCEPDRISPSQCDVCLGQKYRLHSGSQARRRSFWNETLASVDAVLSNTEGVLALFARIYPAIAHHRQCAVLPVPVADCVTPRVAGASPLSLPLKVAVFGNFSVSKGGDILLRCLAHLAGAPIEFHVLGRIDPVYYEFLRGLAGECLFLHGAYNGANLADLIGDCHVSLHVSVWPETYCLTLAEAWRLHLVPIVTDIGALGERVRHGVNGFVIPCRNEGALIDLLLQLAHEPASLERLRARIVQGQEELYVTEQDHLAALTALYARLLPSPSAGPGQESGLVPIEPLSARELGIFRQASAWGEEGAGLLPTLGKGGVTPSPGLSPAVKAYRYYQQHGFSFVVRKTLCYLRRHLL